MIKTLPQKRRKTGDDDWQDTWQSVLVRILKLKSVRALPRTEDASIEEACDCQLRAIGIESRVKIDTKIVAALRRHWLTAIGIRRPDVYVSHLTRQVRARRDRWEAEQRIASRRRSAGLPPPKRRFRKGDSNPGWEEPTPLGELDRNAKNHNPTLEKVERNDENRTLHEEIRRLSADDQTLFRQVYWEKRPIADLARERGQTASKLRSHLDRLRDQLKITLVRRFGGSPL